MLDQFYKPFKRDKPETEREKKKCPYCGEEMTAGYIQSARQIFFSKREHRIMFEAEEGEIEISGYPKYTKESYYCEKCKIVITDLNNPTE